MLAILAFAWAVWKRVAFWLGDKQATLEEARRQ
jgi:hypothetical protein